MCCGKWRQGRRFIDGDCRDQRSGEDNTARDNYPEQGHALKILDRQRASQWVDLIGPGKLPLCRNAFGLGCTARNKVPGPPCVYKHHQIKQRKSKSSDP